MPRRGVCVAALAASVVAAAPPAPAPTPAACGVSVDVGHPAGAFDFTYGVDHGPLCDSGVSVASELRAMGATLIRTHDSGVLDWPVVYPHPAFDHPTDDPASYVWDAADAYWGRIVDAGLVPYLRLGTSWGQLGGGLPPAGVPYNRTALVDVLLHTVMHYREGWGGGRNFSGTSPWRHVEIWNEPDSAVTGSPRGRFWNRSAADFYDLVHDTAVAVKTYDRAIVVATDGVALATGAADAPYSWGLIDELAKRSTPIDAFSWHAYTDNVPLFAGIAAAVRSHLDAAGMANVTQHVTEWFPCILCQEQDTAKGAAAFGATLATLIDSGVTLATLYPLCSSDEGHKTGGHGWGLFDDETLPGTAVWRPLTHVYAEFGDLMQRTPLRLTPAAGLPPGLAVVAGRSAPSPSVQSRGGDGDGDGDGVVEVRALVSATAGASCSRVALTVGGLGRGGPDAPQMDVTVTVANASGSAILALATNEPPAPGGALTVAFDLAPPAVASVRLVGRALRKRP